MKKHIKLITAASAALVITAASSNAATMLTTSTSAPTFDGADIGFLGTTVDQQTVKSWKDAGPRGQTFTTGLAATLLNSFSLKVLNPTLAIRNNEYVVRLGTITVDVFTAISSTTVDQTIDTLAGSWNTFTFDAPVALSASTTYAVDVQMTESDTHSGTIPYYYYNRNAAATFAGGSYYTGDLADANDISLATNNDFQFHADMTAVPEPSTTALLGLGGLALILRRRK